jgi:hypothetical protein
MGTSARGPAQCQDDEYHSGSAVWHHLANAISAIRTAQCGSHTASSPPKPRFVCLPMVSRPRSPVRCDAMRFDSMDGLLVSTRPSAVTSAIAYTPSVRTEQ